VETTKSTTVGTRQGTFFPAGGRYWNVSVRETVREAYAAALPVLSLGVVGGLVAGTVLGGMRAELRTVPGLLALVPALLATRGNVYGSLGARLSTALHQGLLEPRVAAGDRRLRAAVAGAIASGALASVFAALLTVVTLSALGLSVAGPLELAAIALLSALMSGVVLSALVVAVVVVGYRHGLDPDTLIGPTVTVAGDVFGLALLLVAVRIVLALSRVVSALV